MSLLSITKVITPAASVLLTDLATVKDELQISDTSKDAYFNRAIGQVSQTVINYANRVIQIQSYQHKFWPQQDPYPGQIVTGVMPLQLPVWPLVKSSVSRAVAAPSQPVLSSTAGGSLAARTFYVKITYVAADGETIASQESQLAVIAGNLLQVASPAPDAANQATGWNVYVARESGTQTKQNTSPIAIGTPWSLPITGLISGLSMPSPTVTEFGVTLQEGVDYTVDEDNGQLTRLDMVGQPRRWPALPIVVQQQSGYATVPLDLVDATLRAIKGKYFSRTRDPSLRSENASGIYEAAYWFGAGPGTTGDLVPDVMAILDRYKVPVIGGE